MIPEIRSSTRRPTWAEGCTGVESGGKRSRALASLALSSANVRRRFGFPRTTPWAQRSVPS
eukprot:scaffold49708_cov202-Isochrysis_galbana.AAC.1